VSYCTLRLQFGIVKEVFYNVSFACRRYMVVNFLTTGLSCMGMHVFLHTKPGVPAGSQIGYGSFVLFVDGDSPNA
jgi:hypothetical protein